MRTTEIQRVSTSELATRTGPVMAIDIRRAMIQAPAVMDGLKRVEKYVLVASTKRPISEIEEAELIPELGKAFVGIARDTGYTIPTDKSEWREICARIYKFIVMYFGWVTISELKLAFEMAASGDLAEFLPKNEASHYQKFNIDYFGRILNAYRRYRGETIGKANKMLPAAEDRKSAEELEAINRDLRDRAGEHFRRYQETGRAEFAICEDMFIYEIMREKGLCEDVYPNEQDKERALNEYTKFAINGLVNNFKLSQVKNSGVESPEILGLSYTAARRRVIVETYKRIIEEEINYFQILNIKKND